MKYPAFVCRYPLVARHIMSVGTAQAAARRRALSVATAADKDNSAPPFNRFSSVAGACKRAKTSREVVALL
jgi:hypothetical protein